MNEKISVGKAEQNGQCGANFKEYFKWENKSFYNVLYMLVCNLINNKIKKISNFK